MQLRGKPCPAASCGAGPLNLLQLTGSRLAEVTTRRKDLGRDYRVQWYPRSCGDQPDGNFELIPKVLEEAANRR